MTPDASREALCDVGQALRHAALIIGLVADLGYVHELSETGEDKPVGTPLQAEMATIKQRTRMMLTSLGELLSTGDWAASFWEQAGIAESLAKAEGRAT